MTYQNVGAYGKIKIYKTRLEVMNYHEKKELIMMRYFNQLL